VEFPLRQSQESLSSAAARLVSDPIVRRALTTASPSLVSALEDETRHDPSGCHALVRYLERMRGRATPFALLAGYAVVVRDAQQPLGVHLAPREEYRHVVRLDVESVARIVEADAVARREQVPWTVRADLVRFPDIVRVVTRGDDALSYEDIARSAALDAILDLGRTPRSFVELTQALPERHSAEARAAFVARMIDAGVLVPARLPPLRDDDERSSLANVPGCEGLLEMSTALRSTPLGEDVGERLRVFDAALRAHQPSSTAGSGLIHDLLKPVVSAGLGGEEVELRKLVDLLLSVARPEPDTRLATFLKHFVERYELRVVRLVDALDEERGFDFPAPDGPSLPNDPWELVRKSLGDKAHAPGVREVELTEHDVALLQGAMGEAPTSGAALACKLAIDADGRLEVWEPYLSIGRGAAFFARATGIDRDLCERTRRWLAEAAASGDGDVDTADISYFVIGKTAATSQYPTLRRVEITLTSVTASANSIDVNDLLLSVRGGRFVLSNARTGRRVMLRWTNAVRYAREDTTSIVRFLDALAIAEVPHARTEWTDPEVPFSPRVRWGRHVLAAACWRLDATDLEALRAAPNGQQLLAVSALRARLELPRHVLYKEGADHWLHVDLECPFSVGAWLDIAKAPITLKENFPFERSAVVGPEGHYVHEAIFPLTLTPSSRQASAAKAGPLQPSVRDAILPGGPWLYLDVFGSRQELLLLLVELADDVLEPLRAAGAVAHWFYLPFAAPDPHLRIRAKGEDLLQTLLPRLRNALEPAIEKQIVCDVSIRTYERETYRYGGPFGMSLTEEVWARSSHAAVARLKELGGIFDLQLEDLVCEVVALHAWLLEHSTLTAKEKQAVAAQAFERYNRADKPIEARRMGADLHRKLRGDLTLEPSTRDEELERLLARIDRGSRAGDVSRTLPDLLADYLHTQTFRLTTPWHPLAYVEALSYVVLEKCYASIAARARP
jgi:thiopeptide-type bacteriocin biosynthesis protein